MLKSFIFKFFMFVFFTASAGLAWGTGADDACKAALAQAGRDVSNKRDNAPVNTSSTNSSGGQQQGSGNPISDIINKMAESQQKQAELAQKAAEEARNLANDRFKQINELNDKIHDFQKGDYKRRMDIKDAQTALKKQQSMIRIKCQAKAEDDYAKEFAKNDALSARAQYQTGDASHMAGTDKRMQQTLDLYKRRCLSNPATREEQQNVQDEYDGKIHNFQIVAEEITSDVNYTDGKIDLLNAHFAQQQAELQTSLAAQKAALAQQQTMQMIGLGISMMTSAAGNSSQNQAAAEFNSADQVLQNWNAIESRCNPDNKETQAYGVPYDIYPLFETVNSSCRQCIQNSGKSSGPTPRTGTSG